MGERSPRESGAGQTGNEEFPNRCGGPPISGRRPAFFSKRLRGRVLRVIMAAESSGFGLASGQTHAAAFQPPGLRRATDGAARPGESMFHAGEKGELVRGCEGVAEGRKGGGLVAARKQLPVSSDGLWDPASIRSSGCSRRRQRTKRAWLLCRTTCADTVIGPGRATVNSH